MANDDTAKEPFRGSYCQVLHVLVVGYGRFVTDPFLRMLLVPGTRFYSLLLCQALNVVGYIPRACGDVCNYGEAAVRWRRKNRRADIITGYHFVGFIGIFLRFCC